MLDRSSICHLLSQRCYRAPVTAGRLGTANSPAVTAAHASRLSDALLRTVTHESMPMSSTDNGRTKQTFRGDGHGKAGEWVRHAKEVVEAIEARGQRALAEPIIQRGLRRLAGFREPGLKAAIVSELMKHRLTEAEAFEALHQHVTWPDTEAEDGPVRVDDANVPWQAQEFRTIWLRSMSGRESGVATTRVLMNAAVEGAQAIAIDPSLKQGIVDALEAVRVAGEIGVDEGQAIIALAFKGGAVKEEAVRRGLDGEGADRTARKVEPFPYILAGEINRNAPRVELIAGIVLANEVVGIFGPTEAGKTNLKVDMACHVAVGWPWCGHRVRQGPVVIFAPERPEMLKRRIAAWKIEHGVEEFPLAVVGDQIDLRTNTKDADRVVETVRVLTAVWGRPPVWIFYDTYAAIGAGSDEGPRDSAVVMKNIEYIHKKTKATQSPLQHSPVDRDDRPRGHGSTPATMASDIQVTKPEVGRLRALVRKGNDLPDGERACHEFTYKSVVLHVDEHGEEVTAPVLVPVPIAKQASKGDRKKVMTAPMKLLRDAFNEAVAKVSEVVRLPGVDGKVGPEVTAVNLAVVREEFNRRCATGEADQKKRAEVQRSYWRRARDSWAGEFVTQVDGDKELIWRVN
jgi:hypothetical protein